MQLMLTEQVDFGITVVVVTDSKETHDVQNITIPALGEGEFKCCNLRKTRKLQGN